MFIKHGFFYKNIYINYINSFYIYAYSLTSKFHRSCSVLGLVVFIVICIQCFSGFMVALSLSNDCMLVASSRESEDMDDLYVDDFWWLHERGVDFIFIFSYFHLLRKFYIGSYSFDQKQAWKSGVFSFLIFQVVTFLGLSLCCTHLSSVTLSIAAGIANTLTLKTGKFFWWVLTDNTLNTDCLIRLMYLHYVLGFYMIYLGTIHSVDMHYAWEDSSSLTGIDLNITWFDEVFKSEINYFTNMLILLFIISSYWFNEPEPLSYELFMWGDSGLINDIRFYGVAPHWYFRGFMGWLIICPHHYLGIFGLVGFFVLWYFQPELKKEKIFVKTDDFLFIKEYSLFYNFYYMGFVLSLFYCISCLPYGGYYNRLGGNISLLFSYFYVLIFLSSNKLFYEKKIFY